METSREIMYDQHSILIVAVLFFLIFLANETGYRIGKYYQEHTHEDVKAQTYTIQAGTLGLLALILGFTFNMSLNRFNNRSQAVIHEANTIGTALLRTQLLPSPYDTITFNLLQKYVDLRLEISNTDRTKVINQEKLQSETREMQGYIWFNAVMAAKIDSRSVTTGYFIDALNAMIDAYGERNARLQLHVPEVILVLLFVVFIVSGGLMGYASGIGRHRTMIPSMLMAFLICLVVFIIIDLDRPKRGMIMVKQNSMLQLKEGN